MYDFVIVGAGLFGATFAQLASAAGHKILVVDKNNHIGGNCFTELKNGFHIHKYGIHIFHTSSDKIWKYIQRFTEFNHFVNRPKVTYKKNVFSFPINLMTLNQIWGITTPQDARRKLDEVKIKCDNPRNLEEWILSQVGQELYEIFIYGYTKKQWMKDPKDLPSSIIRRIPIRLTWDDNYFDDTFQGIPKYGYTHMFENMLANVEVKLGIDFIQERECLSRLAKNIVYTGKIDEYFDYCYGDLEYRTLNFDEHSIDCVDLQGVAQMNHTDIAIPYTRSIEHRHFTFDLDSTKQTIVSYEYPDEYTRQKTPYYPINDQTNHDLYHRYLHLAKTSNVIFGGRLGSYKYYDMHQVIASAFHCWESKWIT